MLLMVVKNLGGLQLTIPDEDIVRALVEEVVQVMEGPLFTAALKVAFAHSMNVMMVTAL